MERLNNLSSSFSCRLPVAALDMASFCFEVGNSYGAADDINDALSCVSQQRFLNWISSSILTSKPECNLKIWADWCSLNFQYRVLLRFHYCKLLKSKLEITKSFWYDFHLLLMGGWVVGSSIAYVEWKVLCKDHRDGKFNWIPNDPNFRNL